jgi:hypothetical protein
MQLPFSPRSPSPVAQQEKFYVPNEDQSLLCRELLESADKHAYVLLAKYNDMIKQLKDNTEGLDNLVSALKQSISILESVCFAL